MVAVLLFFTYRLLFEGREWRGKENGANNLGLAILSIGFLAQYLPWVLVPRSMFIYHYFASIPFVLLATAWVFSRMTKNRPILRHGLLWGHVALAAVFFVLYYPYASGMPTPVEWLDAVRNLFRVQVHENHNGVEAIRDFFLFKVYY